MKQTDKLKSAIQEVGHLLDIWLPFKVKYDNVPSISVAITYKGKVVYNKSFGYADTEKKAKANEHTQYHIASISKTFTSAAILQLLEQKKLKLDDPVSKYIPWLNESVQKTALAGVTIRQVLSHTSGIWRDGNTPHWLDGKFPTDLGAINEKVLFLKPGDEFKYSNYGYALLGEIIEKVSGVSYEKYIQKNILDKLGMTETVVDYSLGMKNVASGYGREIFGNPREKFEHASARAYAPATGFVSSTTDLVKFITVLADKNSEKFLNKKSKLQMMKPHKTTIGQDKYCLGLEQYQMGKRKVYGHGGGYQGFITNIDFDPENEIAVVVLTNCLQSPCWAIVSSIFTSIYTLMDNEKTFTSNKKISGEKYEGIYQNIWENIILVKIKDILVSFGVEAMNPLQGTNKKLLYPQGNEKFLIKGGSPFGSRGELAVFSEFKKGKFQRVNFGATPDIRID